MLSEFEAICQRRSSSMEPQEGGSPPPSLIAATPPFSRSGVGEELLRQSSSPSSGTWVSSTSGVSLGEAIRHSASQGLESWYQLPAEEDASCFPAESRTGLGVTGLENDRTEFPTLEEGTLTLSENAASASVGGLACSGHLEMQDSGLSPRLPLLASCSIQAQKFFDDTLLQRTELDFAPLRGSIDDSEVSEFYSRPLHISDAMQLAATEVSTDLVSGCFTLSQHPLAFNTTGAGDASGTFFLSQHPLPPSPKSMKDVFEAHRTRTETLPEHFNPDGDKDSEVSDSQMLIPTQGALDKHETQPTDDGYIDFITHDGSFLDSSVSAPLLLELLEKEVGLSSSGGSTSDSSSFKMFPDMEPEKKQIQQIEDLGLGEQETESSGPDLHQLLNKEHALELLEKEVGLSSSGRSSLDSSSCNLFSAIVHENRQIHQVKNLGLVKQGTKFLAPDFHLSLNKENTCVLLENEVELSSSGRSSFDSSSYKILSTMVPEKKQMQEVENLDLVDQGTSYKMFSAMATEKNQMQPFENVDRVYQETSYKMFSAVVPQKKQVHQVKNLDVMAQETTSLGTNHIRSLGEGNTVPEFDLSKSSSHTPLKEPYKSSSEVELFPAKSSQTLLTIERDSVDLNESGRSDLSGITVRPVKRQADGVVQDELRKQLCSEIKRKHQEKEASDSKTTRDCTHENANLHPVAIDSESAKTCSEKESTLTEVHSEACNAEVTVSSGYSVERGHQDAVISPFDRPPMDDRCFFGQMAQPISQSTPGVFASRRVKKELLGKIMPFVSHLPGPHVSLREEPSSSSKSTLAQSSGKQHSDIIAYEANSESSETQSALSPPSGRIQSLPTLSYMEKVGSWNLNQPRDKISFDALVLRGLKGESPKKKAYSAVADSLNRLLAQHSSSSSPKRSLAASFGGTSSLTSLNSDDRKQTHSLPLTRSQSYNVISTVSKESLPPEVVLEKNQNQIDQPLEEDECEKGSNTGALYLEERNTSDFREDIQTPAPDNNECSSHGNVANQSVEAPIPVTSPNVVNLLSGSSQEKGYGRRQSSEPGPSTSKRTMEPFSDVSLDNDSNFLNSSHSNSHADHTFASSNGAVSGHSLTSLEVDNYAPYWLSAAKTPDKELNIEERIPTYLRNLGIDQSPSTILNPFVPRGPIRETEFSPSDLRTFKESADTPTISMQHSEGGSLNVVDFSQSSLYSGISTMSTSIPMGSDFGPDTPLPTELSPQFTLRSTNERPVSQYSIPSHPAETQPALPALHDIALSTELSPQLALRSTKETPISHSNLNSPPSENQPDLQTEQSVIGSLEVSSAKEPVNQSLVMIPSLSRLSDDESYKVVLKHVQSVIGKSESGTTAQHLDSETSSPLMEDSLDVDRSGESLSSSFNASLNHQCKDLGNDSFVGSKTLKEIRQLLAEADKIYLGESNPTSPLPSLRDTHEYSSLLWPNLNSSRGSEALGGSTVSHSPLLQRTLSWDASLTGSLTDGSSMVKSTSLPQGMAHLDSYKAICQPAVGNTTLQRHIERKSRPESRENFEQFRPTKVVRRAEPEGCNNAAVGKHEPRDVFLGSGDPSEQSSTEKVSKVLSSRTTELLSSVSDALSGLEQALAMTDTGSGAERPGLRESDESSSVDSLAARVTSLLKGEAPVTRTTQMIQRAKEEEKRACALVKLKLAGQSSDSGADLNEEDRRRIEEIKTELIESAKKAGSAKNLRSMSLDPDCLSQQQDLHRLKAMRLAESPNDIQSHGLGHEETQEISLGQFRPMQSTIYKAASHTADKLRQSDSHFKALTTMDLPAPIQYQKLTDTFCEAANTEMIMLQGKDVDTGLKPTTSTVDGQMDKRLSPPQQLSEEATRPIASITFSSRKRMPSPSVSPILNSITNDAPTSILPLNILPISSEGQIDRRHLGTHKGSPSASPKHHAIDNGHKQTTDKDLLHYPSNVLSKHQFHQGKQTFLDQGSRPSPTEQSHSSESQRDIQRKPLPLGRESPDLMSARSLSNSVVSGAKCINQEHEVKGKRAVNVLNHSSSLGFPQPGRNSPSNQGLVAGNVLPTVTFAPKDQNMLIRDDMVQVWSLGQTNYGKEVCSEVHSPLPSHTETATTSPARKAISCVRVTISPKPSPSKFVESCLVEKSDTPAVSQNRAEARPTGRLEIDAQEKISQLDHCTKVASDQPFEKNQRSLDEPMRGPSLDSYFVHSSVPGAVDTSQNPNLEFLQRNKAVLMPRHVHTDDFDLGTKHQQGSNQTTVSLQTKKSLSDAMTQITTESPEKTTFSAEIYIQDNDGERNTHGSADQKAVGIQIQEPSLNKSSHSSRPTDQPLLLPYRPPGSQEMYYVPYPEDISRISPVRSDTTIESSHSGSNHAVSPKFPAEVLGSGDESASDTVAFKHKEGIYSRWATPKVAWQEDDRAQKAAAVAEKNWESSKTIQSVPKLVQCTIPHPQPERDVDPRTTTPYTSIRHSEPRYRNRFTPGSTLEKDNLQSPGYQEEDENEFSPLKAEVDFSRGEDRDISLALCHQALEDDLRWSTRAKRLGYPLNCQYTDASDRWQKRDHTWKSSNHSIGSLDELWERFLERKTHRLQDSSSTSHGELSLVDRLDRLARLLQNPAAYSLMGAKDEPSKVTSKSTERREDRRRRRQQVHKDGLESAPNTLNLKEHLSKGTRGRTAHTKATPLCSKADWIDDISTDRIKEILQKRHYVVVQSDSSSSKEDRNSLTDSTVATESEIATRTDSDTATQTETCSSVSTIDTLRLIRAFGPEKVCPSSKLSRLYSTIDHQKSRSEVRRKGSRTTKVKEPDKLCFTELLRSRQVTQLSDAGISSDTVSTVSSSWGPSPALTNKKHVRLLHKGVQAGDLEIVMSGTKRNTRDVGMTFPSPNTCREIPTRDSPCANGFYNQPKHDRVQEPEGNGEQKKWPNGILTDKRSRRSRLQPPPGVTWFVPAEDLKSGSRKENQSSSSTGPGLSWYEPMTHTRPWREPLRENNLQEQLIHNQTNNGVHTAVLLKDAENRLPSPFVRVTLQEALKMHRPGFISSSRERIKRLELLREERKLQSVFQSEREQLFNPPEESGGWRGTAYLCSERDELIIQKSRTIPKKEMVQRSKRIYEQLPEIQRKKEEEKRKSEYTSYRLKAQLYKKKVTNHVLGRKTPWN